MFEKMFSRTGLINGWRRSEDTVTRFLKNPAGLKNKEMRLQDGRLRKK